MTTRAAEATLPAPAHESGWAGQAQWGAIAAGSFAGFATTIIMATLGAAIGATVGASLVGESMGGADARETAVGFGIGSVAWMVLTAIVVGFVGGAVLNRTARYDRPYMPIAFAILTWAGGVFLALLVAASGATGLFGSLGAGVMGAAAGRPEMMERAMEPSQQPRGMTANGEAERAVPPRTMTGQEREQAREAAEKTSKGAAAVAWIALGAQLISLASTMLAACWRKAREIPFRYGTQPA